MHAGSSIGTLVYVYECQGDYHSKHFPVEITALPFPSTGLDQSQEKRTLFP